MAWLCVRGCQRFCVAGRAIWACGTHDRNAARGGCVTRSDGQLRAGAGGPAVRVWHSHRLCSRQARASLGLTRCSCARVRACPSCFDVRACAGWPAWRAGEGGARSGPSSIDACTLHARPRGACTNACSTGASRGCGAASRARVCGVRERSTTHVKRERGGGCLEGVAKKAPTARLAAQPMNNALHVHAARSSGPADKAVHAASRSRGVAT